MKVIERSIEILPQSATRIASSMEAAATTVAEQGKAFADDVTACANSLKTDVQAIAGQVTEIPSLIDPAPILASCTEALNVAVNDLRRLGSEAGAIPKRLLEQAATVQQVIDQASKTAKALPGAIPALSKLVPDFQAQIAFFNSLPARGDALAEQARRAIGMFEQYGRQLIPLSQQLAQSGPHGLADGSIAQSLAAQAKSLQSDSLAQVQSLRALLRSNVADLASGVDGISVSALQAVGGAADLLRKAGSDLMAPLQAQIDYVERMQAALSQEADTCDALFTDFSAQLDRVGDIALKPMQVARGQVDAVIEQLQAAAANVDAMLKKALQPVDALEARAGTIKQALDDVVSVVGEEATQIQGLLAELDADVEKAKTALLALPENFTPVRAKIAEAVALLEDIKGRIPVFVAQANRALDGAAAELDQAEGLCNNAIEICTRYMMKAPPLMAARTLFVGVKAMIPGVKTAIATARKTVGTAGTQASGLLDQGIATVEALYPLLDQAMAQLKASIDALVAILVKLQAALQQVSDTIGAIPPELSTQLNAATDTMHQVLDKVRATVEECLAKMGCEALVQRLQQELSATLDRAVATIDQKIKEGSAPLQTALQQGREGVAKAAQAAQDGLRTLHSALMTAQVQAQKPIQQLDAIMTSGQSHITALSGGAKQQISQAESKVLSIVDQIAQKISSLNIDLPNLPSEVQTAAGGYAAFAATISADAQALARRAGSLQDWQETASQCNEQIATDIDKASAEATQGLDEVKSASDDLRSEAQSASENAIDADAAATGIDETMTGMKQEAQAAADDAEAAHGDMETSLAETSVEAEGVTNHYAPVSERLLKDAQAKFDSAAEVANEAKEAEQGLAADIVAAEDSVGKASQEAAARTEAIKNEAQAGIDAALTEVQGVQAQVESARSDVIKAEAIVDAEVVKHGGESALAKQAEAEDSKQNDKAETRQDGVTKETAASDAPKTTSGAPADAGQSASAASENTTSAATDGEATPATQNRAAQGAEKAGAAGSNTEKTDMANASAGSNAESGDKDTEADGGIEDSQEDTTFEQAAPSDADADVDTDAGVMQKRSATRKPAAGPGPGAPVRSAKADIHAQPDEPQSNATISNKAEPELSDMPQDPADESAVIDAAALNLPDGAAVTPEAVRPLKPGTKDRATAAPSTPSLKPQEATGEEQTDLLKGLKKVQPPGKGLKEAVPDDAMSASAVPTGAVSPALPQDAKQMFPSRGADVAGEKGPDLKGLDRQVMSGGADKAGLAADRGMASEGLPTTKGGEGAALSAKPELPADSAPPGSDGLSTASATAKDGESAIKEALRARLSDAAGKELA